MLEQKVKFRIYRSQKVATNKTRLLAFMQVPVFNALKKELKGQTLPLDTTFLTPYIRKIIKILHNPQAQQKLNLQNNNFIIES